MALSSSASKSEPSGVSMDVLSLLRLLVRHWRVTVPAALLTVLALVAALKSSSPTYEATGSTVLFSPPEPPDANGSPESAPTPEEGQNPFARYGDLAVVSDILARVMDSDSKRAELESLGVTGYDVVANRFERGPVVEVTGQGPSSQAAIGSTEIVLAEVDSVLSELQQAEGADPEYFIKSAPLEPPSTATAKYGSTVRAAIAALAVGALCTLSLAVIAESIMRRRAARLTAAVDPPTSDAANPGTEGGAPNGSAKADWSRILPALRLARVDPSKEEPERSGAAQAEPSKREPAGKRTARREQPSKREPAKREPAKREPATREPATQEPAWRKAARTFQEEPSSESAADNGHEQPTTDRSP
jgi:hypothetical protein